MATRGCPYACSYCFNNAYRHLYSGLGKMVRRRSVESLITEIEEVHSRYPMNFVRFGDDVFVIKDDEWLDEFVESYRSRIRLPFYCLIRPNLVTDSIVTKLKAAGCHSVSISLESGSAKLRKTILNRSIDDATIIEAYDTLNRHGINTFSNAMLGLPGATIEDDLSSLEMSFRLKPIYSSFTVFTPFPGTDLYRLCVERGDIDENFDEESFPESTFSSSLLRQSTDLDHRIHKNIMMLGALAVSCPAIRNLIMKHLLYWRPNILFSVIGFVVRNYRQRKIWPVRVGILGFMRLVWRVLKLDLMNYRR